MNERIFVPLEHLSYAKYLWDLTTAANRHQLTMMNIGSEQVERTGIVYPLYQLVVNPEAVDNVCIVAGVHGAEIAGPLSVLKLLQDHLDELPGCFRYMIFPMLNPSGFDLRQRFDDDYRDLNALYATTLGSRNYGEIQAFYRQVRECGKFAAVITLHEDTDLDWFYMYGLGEHNRAFYHRLCRLARQRCPCWADADIYGCHSDEHGLILATSRDHALDGALYAEGLTPVAMTLETPGKREIGFRVELMLELLLAALHDLAGNVDQMHET
jgi:predicted deacylase